MSEKKNLCKRCNLDESLKGIEFEIDSYIASMDQSIKADANEYEKRLALCSDCVQLMNGVCRMCGCFVKARAAKNHMACPLTPPKW